MEELRKQFEKETGNVAITVFSFKDEFIPNPKYIKWLESQLTKERERLSKEMEYTKDLVENVAELKEELKEKDERVKELDKILNLADSLIADYDSDIHKEYLSYFEPSKEHPTTDNSKERSNQSLCKDCKHEPHDNIDFWCNCAGCKNWERFEPKLKD